VLAPRPRPGGAAAGLARRLEGARRAAPAAVGALAVVVVATGVALGTRGAPSHGPENVTRCNGHEQLCRRPVNEVAFAATHNSMAAAEEPGWFRAEHTGGIAAQLRFGIRGFLIDTWYGAPSERGVATDFERSGMDRQALVREYGAEAVAAVERLHGRLGFRPLRAEPAVYLCHIACEVGATPLEDALREFRAFLARNPGEVLVLVIQDQVSPEDTRRAFLRTGLREYVLTPDGGGEWPTLGEMIDRGERVVVMSEDLTDPAIPWLLPAFEVMEETPYSFPSPGALSCRPNRGGVGRPFFQLNHWIERPIPTPKDAALLNARDFLLERASRCARERGQIPNIVAVNFYESGDLRAVVDALNGIGEPG
jgi:hypothetical protein